MNFIEELTVACEELKVPVPEMPYRIENWPQEDLVMYVGGDKELYR